ncbi:MAG: malto-oligosyltrehalose synthase [Gammaproteobacteria bacterium]|nr:malto-oligosyltrehalose synthase [Gammaproteobacteria bacterium]
MTPRATYRLQFHKGFTFEQAEAIVPYLDRLGVSHIYASPITVATRGSTHGYDVVDPTRINPELGGEPGFRRLVAALRARGMGMIIDIVPNHMGVAGGENVWWNDVLARGQASPYARFFDIDWREKLVLPVLGEPLGAALDNRQIRIEREDGAPVLTAYGEHRFPIREADRAGLAATDDPATIRALLDRQHYRLASWRVANDELNWRRFFTISELAGLRAVDPAAFEATHALPIRLYGEGLIDGVRVDHVDGLTDPAGYCRQLRAGLDSVQRPADAPPGPAYIVIEKILASGEPLAPDWGVDGSSGYDFMAELGALLHDPDGEAALDALWADFSGRTGGFQAVELRARQDMLDWAFHGQLGRCVAAFDALARSTPEADGVTAGMLHRAIERLLWVFPVYRTYGTGGAAPASDARIREAARQRVQPFVPPGEDGVVDRVLAWLAGEGPGDPALAADAVRRFQQLSAPVAAKGVEDTAFYRYGRLLSRNDVGFDAGVLASPIAEFHEATAARAARFPHSMLATATHDHKRGEDVRARLAVLSELPELWREHVVRWRAMARPFADGVDAGDQYMLFQTLFGAWPDGLDPQDAEGLRSFAVRVNGWQEKALREAKLRSSWEAPDPDYEGRCRGLTEALLDPARSSEFLTDIKGLINHLDAPARANSLAQVALHYTAPGVPDLYQGVELPDFSLVDPDNRRPVDFGQREKLLTGTDRPSPGADKLALIARLLDLRRRNPDLFANGDYRALTATGPRAGNLIAFQRRWGDETLSCVFAIRCAQPLAGAVPLVPNAEWWGDTAVRFETGARSPRLVADLLVDSPVLVRIEGSASDAADPGT